MVYFLLWLLKVKFGVARCIAYAILPPDFGWFDAGILRIYVILAPVFLVTTSHHF
jgi:hypothetical protein